MSLVPVLKGLPGRTGLQGTDTNKTFWEVFEHNNNLDHTGKSVSHPVQLAGVHGMNHC